MSDLSKNSENVIEEFNAHSYVSSLCSNTKITIWKMAKIEFQQGWKIIVRDLIESIKNYHIEILQISDDYSVIEIDFAMIQKTGEVIVLRQLQNIRQASKSICALCGNCKGNQRSKTIVSMFCEDCSKNSGNLAKTGTWLDKY